MLRTSTSISKARRDRAGIHFSTALGRLASLLGCWLAGWAIHLGAWVRSVTYGENILSESQAGITITGKALFLVCTCSIACLVAVAQVPTNLAHHFTLPCRHDFYPLLPSLLRPSLSLSSSSSHSNLASLTSFSLFIFFSLLHWNPFFAVFL